MELEIALNYKSPLHGLFCDCILLHEWAITVLSPIMLFVLISILFINIDFMLLAFKYRMSTIRKVST